MDDPHNFRALWERLELTANGEVVRLKEWLLFRTEFEVARENVSDYTKQE